jgi:hypothetical protein
MLKPAYKLTIGRKSGAAAGPLGAVSNVAAAVPGSGGAKVIDTTSEPQASTLIDLVATLDMDGPASSFTLVMGQVGSFKVEQDAEVTIELGYADNGVLTQVMIGGVVHVEPTLITRRITGHSSLQLLHHTYVDQTYEEKNAGQIVRDLAEQAGVSVASAENGISFPAYVIDGRRCVARHLRDLAGLCGFDLYVNADNELVFKPFTGGATVHVLDYARHILALEIVRTPATISQVEAWGESAGSGAADTWAWLTKDFSGLRGTAGSGNVKSLLERPALRTGAAARTAANALLTDLERRAMRGSLLIAGRPEVKLGDAVRLREVPEASLNGDYQVRSVTHYLNKQAGYTTSIGFRSL